MVYFSMEGQKTLGLNLKYLKLCSEDERAFKRNESESLMTQFLFLGELTLYDMSVQVAFS